MSTAMGGVGRAATVAMLVLATTGVRAAIEEIVVTATKRGEVSVQDIPAGITAVSGDFLNRSDVRSFDELARVVPSLQFAKGAIGDLQPIIRGIQSPGAGTVGVYFDETVVTGANFEDGGGRTPDIGAYDIARVEVLKGPQGTLFGASSMSGTVRIISNKPDARAFDSNVSVRGSSLEDGSPGYGANGMINVPVIDGVLAVRGVGWYEKGGGFIDAYNGLGGVTKDEDADSYDKTGGRIMLRFTPNERLTVDAFALYQKIDVDGPVGFSDVPTGTMLPIPLLVGPPFLVGTLIPGQPGVVGDRILTELAREENSSEIHLFGGTAEYEFNFGSLLATVNKFELDPSYIGQDTSGIATSFLLLDPVPPGAVGTDLPIPLCGNPGPPPWRCGLSTPFRLQQTQYRDVLSAEIRFSSKFDGPLNFVSGVFYQQDDSSTDLMVARADPVTGRTLCKDHPSCVADPTSAAAQSLVFGTLSEKDVESYALFGHADWDVLERVTLGAGVRYYDADERDRSSATQQFQGSTPFTLPPAFGGPVQTVPILGLDDSDSVSEVTWDASASYRFDDAKLVYFRAATGFRQGGVNDSNSARQLGATIPGTYAPDTVQSYEIGFKTSWFEDRLTANGAYFKMFWNDIQVPGQDPTGSVNFVANAAKAEIDGFELELAAVPTDQWFMGFAVTWLDAELTQDQELEPGTIIIGGIPFDTNGNRIPQGLEGDNIPKVPEWAFSGQVEYRVPYSVFDGVATTLGANFAYTKDSKRYLNDSFENNKTIGDYFLLNLNANFTYKNYELRLFCRNVTDESAIVDYDGNGTDPQKAITVEPRAVGAQLSWHFD